MSLKSFLKKIKSAESAVSVFLGVAVVIVVGIMLFNYFRNYTTASRESGKGNPESTESQTSEKSTSRSTLPAKYLVTAGDSLWKISEKFYGNGFNWIDISRENKINRPDQILVGQELVIPNVPAKQPLVAKPQVDQSTEVGAAISGSQYTVVKGDTLWKISVRAYQDGFKWQEIAQANHLTNPNIIHPGNVLTIPR